MNIVLKALVTFALLFGAGATAKSPEAVDPCQDMVVKARSFDRSALLRFSFEKIDDALQDATISLLAKCRKDGFASIADPKAWLFTATQRNLYKQWNVEKARTLREAEFARRQETFAIPVPAMAPDAASRLLKEAGRLSRTLSEGQLLTLQDRLLTSRTAEEIAADRGDPLTTIQGQIRDSKDAFAGVVKRLGPELGDSATANFEVHPEIGAIIGVLVVGLALYILYRIGEPPGASNWRDFEKAAAAAAQQAQEHAQARRVAARPALTARPVR
ncbi:hypothetical protein ACQKLX_10035 [Bosea sp. NPDC003192]|uniref:hypothetical protein n=1 Tax=Bosea sp. NPDC003192 TaxID=3390551 RepID=UPI003D05B36B